MATRRRAEPKKQPLRYRLEPDGAFTLWRAGEDRRDDGGDPEPRDREPWYWWRSQDSAWPRPASQKDITAWEESEAAKRANRNSRSSGQKPVPLSPELLRRYGLTPPDPAPKAASESEVR